MKMTRLLPITLLTIVELCVPVSHATELDPAAITYLLPDQLSWKKGAATDSVMLQGDTSKSGIYIQLMRWHPNNMSRPHSHDGPRYITVLSGTWWVGTGSTFDPARTKPMPAGSYVVDLPNELHFDGAKDEECVLMIVGMGPVKTSSGIQVGPIK